MKKLSEIIARRQEITAQLELNKRKAMEKDIDSATLDKLLEETRSLNAEYSALKMEEIELRSQIEQQPTLDNPIGSGSEQAVEERRAFDKLDKMTLRQKVAFSIGRQARGGTFSEIEVRALGTALTTTAKTYVAASASADGVNNAGVFIPTNIVFDLLRSEKKLSPILEDIIFTNTPGLTSFPVRKSRSNAKYEAEGKFTEGDGQMEWEVLQGKAGYIQTNIAITDEVSAMTDEEFGAYIVEQLLQDFNEDWAKEIIYGTGTGEAIKGITIGALDGSYTGTAFDGIIAGVKLCTGQFRRGAKIYVAQDIADDILFAKNKNGSFQYPVINNPTGILSVGTMSVAVDENLKAGDFIIGNVGKYYKANNLIPLHIEKERKVGKRITQIFAGQYLCTLPLAGAFVYGKKTTASAGGNSDAGGGTGSDT